MRVRQCDAGSVQSSGPRPATTPATHDERLWPSPVGWVAVPGFAAMLGIAVLPVNEVGAVVAAVVGAVAAAAAAVASATRVRVTSGELHAGAAHVPVTLLRHPRALDPEQTRHELGPGLDARAYLGMRGWVRTAVRVELDDPADPTPYWVVSTRRPQDLVQALVDAGAIGAPVPGNDDDGRTTEVPPAS